MATFINPQNCKDCVFCDKMHGACEFRGELLKNITIDDTLDCIYADSELASNALHTLVDIWDAELKLYTTLERLSTGMPMAKKSINDAIRGAVESHKEEAIMAFIKFAYDVYERTHPMLDDVVCSGFDRLNIALKNPSNSNRTPDDMEGG